MSVVLGYLGAAVVGLGMYLVFAGLAHKPAKVSPLEHLRGEGAKDPRESELARPLAVRLIDPLVRKMSQFGRRITPSARTDALRRRLDYAGMSVPAEAFLAGKAIGAGVGLLVAFGVLLVMSPTGGVSAMILLTGVVVGAYAPDLLIMSRAQERQEEISRDLPEALDLLALTVRAGMGLEQALAEVAGEVTGPLGEELDRALKEQQLGRSRREALESLKERNSSEDLRGLVSALLHADRLGTPLAETLSVQAREQRRRRRAAARERAGKAPVKLLFPMIFGIFPAMFVIIIGPAILRIIDALF